MKKALFPFVLLVILIGCDPVMQQVAIFKEPQPAGKEKLDAFPGKLQGRYVSEDQSSIITIDDKTVTRTMDYDVKLNRHDLDSGLVLKADTLYDTQSHSAAKAIVMGDTVIAHYHTVEQVFAVSDSGVLKKMKGYYFLNTRSQANAWSVTAVGLRKGSLSFRGIYSDSSINKLEEITETKLDSVTTTLKPSRREFRRFIREDGFELGEVFTRVK